MARLSHIAERFGSAIPGLAALLFVLATASPAPAEPIRIVAAENFYGDIAEQIGGAQVAVTSILSNPNQDPHLFEVSASTARAVADAHIVVLNGAGYDPWMAKLLAAGPRAGRTVIEIAALAGRGPGDNPHLWYDPAIAAAYARALSEILADRNPEGRIEFTTNLARFRAALRPLENKITSLRAAHAGAPIAAIEPVAEHLLAAIGLVTRNRRFQQAVMNGVEPSASDIAAFQRDLEWRVVRVLLYNNQTADPLTERLRALAARAGVPVVSMTETAPPGVRYQDWMLDQLRALEAALAADRS